MATLLLLPETARDRGTRHGILNTLATYGRFLATPSFMVYNLIGAMLTAPDRARAPSPAPPQGLNLVEVAY